MKPDRLPPDSDRALRAPLLRKLARVIRGFGQLYLDQRRRRPMILLPSGDLLEIPASLTADATLGDLLIHTGDRWQVLPVGGDDQVLTADSTAALGVAWAAAGGGSSVPDWLDVDQRYMRWNAILGTGQMIDAAGNTLSSSGTVTDQPLAGGAFSRRSLISGNNWAGYRALPAVGAPVTRPQWSPILRCRICTFTSLDGGFFIGLWKQGTQPQDSPLGSAAGSGAHACLRYYSGTDTYWSAASSDGTNTEVTASAVTPASDTIYTAEVRVTDSSAAFYLNGSLIATHTTYIPASTDPLGPIMQVRRFSGASTTAEIGCHTMSLVTL